MEPGASESGIPKIPSYRTHFNARHMQVFSILFCVWVGGLQDVRKTQQSNFMTIEEVGQFLNGMWAFVRYQFWFGIDRNIIVPVNLKDQDAFHLTIEEYLLALISLVEELVSLTCFIFIQPSWLLSVVSARCQFCHTGWLRSSTADQPVCVRHPCWFSAP